MDVIQVMAERFYGKNMIAMALMGSHARGEASQYSDLDLVCITREATAPPAQTAYVDGQLVVISQVTVEQTESWFSDPPQIVEVLLNLRQARILIDPDNVFSQLQQKSRTFEWTSEHQAKANAYASTELVGLIEEVHKGLNGLQNDHAGRLINASHGLMWGLTRIVLVQKGQLTAGDNDLIAGAQRAMGLDSEWTRYCRLAFGIDIDNENHDHTSLVDETRTTLQLYKLTVVKLRDDIAPDGLQLIDQAIAKIDGFL